MAAMPVYSPEELERQYSISAARPDFNSHIVPDWEGRSARFRERTAARLDLAYGTEPREKLDFFPASERADGPVLVFFHGGYWQRFDKSVFSFVAEAFLAHGVSVVLPSYDLCPAVHMPQISAQARRAVQWVWRHAEELGVSRDRLFVAGHSAGGHLTGMLMATDWPAHGADLPSDLVKGGIPISGLFDLEPLRHTAVNKALQMTQAEAAAESPINHAPVTNAPQLVVVGGKESAEFHRQSDAYAAAWTTSARPIERLTVVGRDHCDILDDLTDPGSSFFQKSLHLIVGYPSLPSSGE